jgi:hypothetical protein
VTLLTLRLDDTGGLDLGDSLWFEILVQQYVTVPMPVEEGSPEEKPTRLGDTKRYILNNANDAMKLINYYNGKANTLSISVNPYLELGDDGRVNYDTVFVKRLYFDLDEPRIDDVLTLSNYFKSENIFHRIRFSGQGFHILPYVYGLHTNINDGMMAVQEVLKKELGITFCVDEDAYCRKDRMVRLPNTYNKKRRRYCIPLSNDDLALGYDTIKEMARTQRFIDPVVGNILWDLRKYNGLYGYQKERRDCTKHLNTTITPINIEKALEIVGLDYCEICPAMKYLLNKYELHYKKRYLLIAYLKDICGFKQKETINILKDTLIDDRFRHSHYSENQVYYIYSTNYKHNCDKVGKFGLCPKKCDRSWLNV